MEFKGKLKLDRRTKDLVKRLEPTDIALIDHVDMDRVAAESLIASGVQLVVNAQPSISGEYPNVGPLLLMQAGVTLLDDIGQEPFEKLKEGQKVSISDQGNLFKGSEATRKGFIASGTFQTLESIEASYREAQKQVSARLEEFAQNTLKYLSKEKNIISDDQWVPPITTPIEDRHVLVVVRGYHYKEDLKVLRAYIREMKPVLIGVDGGADALLEAGFKPHIIVGDMDSVSPQALKSGAELIVHAYADGRAPGLEPLQELGLAESEKTFIWPLTATSEDLALILAWEKGADLIVAVGTHNNLIEYLDKGRKGMASTFLVRLKTGPKLVDAKGVSRLYRSSVSPGMLFPLIFAGLVVLLTLFYVSPDANNIVRLILLRIGLLLGI
ncbi:MAG: putative cytokinetic ring protein SteA [Coriobacteriia bacterium]|nr:putative cytokinetic ring protein SteA [Coriobacteriia bacterium]MCL2746148.1 putative cytokinetic ring protein SteA [Coriobacteriia bacterium]MCL2870169.1 putative cytokinetic ring protein SteA [Coriobacteriia bacterium]